MAGDDHHRRAARVSRELRLRLAFGSMDEFIERYALNLSRGGIFVRSRETSPPGTELLLDVALESGDRLVSGRGVVAWTSPPSAPGEPHREPGMGIKFIELTRESRALVDLVVGTQEEAVAYGDEPPIPAEVNPSTLRRAPPDRAGAPPAPAPAPGPGAGAGPGPRPGPGPGAGLGPGPRPDPARKVQDQVRVAPRGPVVAPAPSSRPAPRPRPTGPVVGIDLGTTYSCVAFARGGKARVLASKLGQLTVPSVVAYDAQGRLLVGDPAKRQMVVNPRHTVYGSKRLVGRPFGSPTVQACRDRFHYQIVEAPDGAAAVRFAGRDYSLQQVSALVLRELREIASAALGEAVVRAVVTVPAYYNEHQRAAVRDAGRLAGLHVERIVNEPTAAALAFGYGRGLDQRVLVYDLGGGTFDASVLEIQGDVYEVVSTGGDTFLGGVDFDGQLVDHLVARFQERHGFPPPDDPVAWQRLRDAAEQAKIALSAAERTTVAVPYLCRDEGGRVYDLEVQVTRAELESLTGRLVDRSVAVCLEVLAAKGLGPADVHEVLLVGGQSRMPLVWRRIAEAFGREPNKSVHPDEAVAIGAALLADSAARIDSVVLIDVLAMGIGIGLPGGRMAPLLPRNTALPAKRSHEIATTREGQTELELQVFQGDSPKVSECEYLGTVKVPKLPARPRGEVRVAFEFAVGAEGLLTATARELATGRTTVVRLATLDTPESLREKLQLTEAASAPAGSRPLAPPGAQPPAGAPRGLLGRLFRGKL